MVGSFGFTYFFFRSSGNYYWPLEYIERKRKEIFFVFLILLQFLLFVRSIVQGILAMTSFSRYFGLEIHQSPGNAVDYFITLYIQPISLF